VIVFGFTSIVTAGFSVTVVLATASGSALLLAVTTMVCWLVITDGAVYKPAAEMLPVAGAIDQVTLVSVAPVAVAVNCCVCEAKRVACDGVTPNDTVGRSRIVKTADCVESAALVAVTCTVWGVDIEEGAV
jgi:hypothetical protein